MSGLQALLVENGTNMAELATEFEESGTYKVSYIH